MATTRTYTYITEDNVSYDIYMQDGREYHRYLASGISSSKKWYITGLSSIYHGTKEAAREDLVKNLKSIGVKIKPNDNGN